MHSMRLAYSVCQQRKNYEKSLRQDMNDAKWHHVPAWREPNLRHSANLIAICRTQCVLVTLDLTQPQP